MTLEKFKMWIVNKLSKQINKLSKQINKLSKQINKLSKHTNPSEIKAQNGTLKL